MSTYSTTLQCPLGDAGGIAATHVMNASEVADLSGAPAPPETEAAEHAEPGSVLTLCTESGIAAEAMYK